MEIWTGNSDGLVTQRGGLGEGGIGRGIRERGRWKGDRGR
jgi:hypothetical protein